MNIIFLTKRQYTGKDLLDDCYGRLFELPLHLAEQGHNVYGLCLSYRKRKSGIIQTLRRDKNLIWISFNSGYFFVIGLVRFIYKAITVIKAQRTDLIIGCSDSIHIICAYFISRLLGVPYVIDLYDNFESFAITKIPGIKSLYVRAIRNAKLVICVSKPLMEFVNSRYNPRGRVVVLENAIDENIFRKLDKSNCRRELGLPLNKRIVGTLGALDASRNIQILYRAFQWFESQGYDIHLALAGRPGEPIYPSSLKVHFLGNLAHDHIPTFLNALDVAVICLDNNMFCNYCFPQKAYEIIACRTPVVAANVGAIADLLHDYKKECIFEPADTMDLFQKLIIQLEAKVVPDIKVANWREQGKLLENYLKDAISQ